MFSHENGPSYRPATLFSFMTPKESWCTVYGTIFSFPPPPAPSEALLSSSLIPASLITDSANFNTRVRQPRVNEEKRGRKRLHATPAYHEMVARHPDGNYDSLA